MKITRTSIQRAFNKALKDITNDTSLTSCSRDAGLVLEPGKKGERSGYQAFVRVMRFSEKLLAEQPATGGLVEYKVSKKKSKSA